MQSLPELYDEPGLDRVRHRARAVGDGGLDVDAVEDALDRRGRYVKLSGDLRAGAAVGRKLKHANLSC